MTSVWYESGAVLYSVPKCRATMTTSAPSRLAREASAMIRSGSISGTDQGMSDGSGMPLVP